MYGRSSSTSGPGDFFLLFRGFRGSDRKPHSDDGRRDARECRSLSRKIFIFVPARHGGRTKGTETAFPQILRSFLPDRLRTRATLIPSIDFIARGNARGRHYLTWNYRDIVRKCLHRTEIISKLSFSLFSFTSALKSFYGISVRV